MIKACHPCPILLISPPFKRAATPNLGLKEEYLMLKKPFEKLLVVTFIDQMEIILMIVLIKYHTLTQHDSLEG